jgi:hypothetical protein
MTHRRSPASRREKTAAFRFTFGRCGRMMLRCGACRANAASTSAQAAAAHCHVRSRIPLHPPHLTWLHCVEKQTAEHFAIALSSSLCSCSQLKCSLPKACRSYASKACMSATPPASGKRPSPLNTTAAFCPQQHHLFFLHKPPPRQHQSSRSCFARRQAAQTDDVSALQAYAAAGSDLTTMHPVRVASPSCAEKT